MANQPKPIITVIRLTAEGPTLGFGDSERAACYGAHTAAAIKPGFVANRNLMGTWAGLKPEGANFDVPSSRARFGQDLMAKVNLVSDFALAAYAVELAGANTEGEIFVPLASFEDDSLEILMLSLSEFPSFQAALQRHVDECEREPAPREVINLPSL